MRASDRAYHALRARILAGELHPGENLGEVDWAERLHVSRTPIREALRRLAAERLVESSGRSYVVAEETPDSIRDLYAVREALDVLAARAAAAAPDEVRALFAELATECTRLDATGSHDVERSYALADALDDALDDAAGNNYLRAAMGPVRSHLARARRFAANDGSRLAEATREHRAVCEAIAAGDPELAEAAVRLHIRRALHRLLEFADGSHLASRPDTVPGHERRTA